MSTDVNLERLERAVRFNARCTTVLLSTFVLLVGTAAGYGGWRASRFLRPENLVQTAEGQIRQKYPQLRQDLKRAADRNAPKLAEQLSRRGLDAVPAARRRLGRYAERKIDEGLDEASALSEQRFRQFLRDNRDVILAGYAAVRLSPSGDGPFVLRAEEALRQYAGADVERNARALLALLDQLAERLDALGSDEARLTRKQQVERRMVRTLRALAEP